MLWPANKGYTVMGYMRNVVGSLNAFITTLHPCRGILAENSKKK